MFELSPQSDAKQEPPEKKEKRTIRFSSKEAAVESKSYVVHSYVCHVKQLFFVVGLTIFGQCANDTLLPMFPYSVRFIYFLLWFDFYSIIPKKIKNLNYVSGKKSKNTDFNFLIIYPFLCHIYCVKETFIYWGKGCKIDFFA